MGKRLKIKDVQAEESAEERKERAREWVLAIMKHTGGSDPIVWYCPQAGKLQIAFGPNMSFMPGATPDLPRELFPEIVDVCHDLGRMDDSGRPTIEYHIAGAIRA
jgi:hypothetical protein